MPEKRKKKTKKTYDFKVREKLVPIAVVVIVVFGTILFGVPTFNKILSQQKLNLETERELTTLEEKLVTLTETNEVTLDQQVVQLESIFPSEKPALSLLLALSGLAREEGVILSAITLNPGKVEELLPEEEEKEIERSRKGVVVPPLKDFTLDFSLEGTLQQVSSFVSRLEKTAPVIKIEEFGLSLATRGGDAGGENRVRINLVVRVFYQASPETLGPIESSLPTFTSEELELLETLNSYVSYGSIQPQTPSGKEDLFAPFFKE